MSEIIKELTYNNFTLSLLKEGTIVISKPTVKTISMLKLFYIDLDIGDVPIIVELLKDYVKDYVSYCREQDRINRKKQIEALGKIRRELLELLDEITKSNNSKEVKEKIIKIKEKMDDLLK